MSNITPGKYRAKASKAAELGLAKTGTEQVLVTFHLLDLGEHISWFGYFTDATAGRTVESLKHCGWDGDWNNMESVCTNEVELDIQEEEYQGQRRMRVAWVNPAGGGIALKQPMTPQERAAFAQRMASTVAGVYGGAPRKAAQPAPRPAAQPQRGAVQDGPPPGHPAHIDPEQPGFDL